MKYFKNVRYYCTDEEVRRMADKYSIKTYLPEFAADIAAFYAGESPLDIEEEDIPVPEFVPDADYGAYKLSNGSYTRSLSSKIKDYVETSIRYHREVVNFILNLPPDIPGETPLEKAFAVIKGLEEEKYSCRPSVDEDSISIPSFIILQQREKAIRSLKERIEILDKLKPEDHNYLQSNGDREIAYFNMDSTAKHIFAVDQFLRTFPKLKVKVANKFIPDNSGKYVFSRSSRELQDLPKIGKSVLLKRHKMAYNIISGKEKVSVRYRKDTKVPLISIMIDNSRSMEDNDKSKRAAGIIYYLVKEVARGNCAGIVTSFVNFIYNTKYLELGTDYTEWFRNEFSFSFNAQVTNVGECAIEFIKKIDSIVEEESLDVDLNQKHLIIINDGQDDASNLSLEVLGNNILHAFILESSNEHIKRLCKATGGIYLEEI